jgi:hypothetical protein
MSSMWPRYAPSSFRIKLPCIGQDPISQATVEILGVDDVHDFPSRNVIRREIHEQIHLAVRSEIVTENRPKARDPAYVAAAAEYLEFFLGYLYSNCFRGSPSSRSYHCGRQADPRQ